MVADGVRSVALTQHGTVLCQPLLLQLESNTKNNQISEAPKNLMLKVCLND